MDAEQSAGGTRGRALLTGASGYIGSRLAPQLLAAGWSLTVLGRHPEQIQQRAWAEGNASVRIVQGDATDASDLRNAFEDVDVAYYLLHSMDGDGDFRERDREMAHTFAEAAAEAGAQRIVYLSGLHPQDVELSEHLGSRAEVGQIFLDGPVPAAVLQAAIIIGSGSASFEMLRHLTHRLPAMITPKWLNSRVQPVAIRDVLGALVAVAELPPEVNRTFDVGGPDALSYRDLIQRFAEVSGLRRRVTVDVPLLSVGVASHWIGLVTPVPTGVAKPLMGSLVHDVVCAEDDVWQLPGMSTALTLDQAITAALAGPARDPGPLPEPGAADPAWLSSADPKWAG